MLDSFDLGVYDFSSYYSSLIAPSHNGLLKESLGMPNADGSSHYKF